MYLIPIKFHAPLNFEPLIFAPFIFRAPLFYCKFAVFHSFMAFFLLPLIFALSYCANLLLLIFAQANFNENKVHNLQIDTNWSWWHLWEFIFTELSEIVLEQNPVWHSVTPLIEWWQLTHGVLNYPPSANSEDTYWHFKMIFLPQNRRR